jgi:hypothetical protein
MNLKRTALIPLVALVVVAVVLSAVTAGILIAQQDISTNGSVGQNISGTINIGVFSDPDASVNCTSIDWGNLNPGDSATKTVYIKNTGDLAETLTMAVVNWRPSTATQALYLTWTQEGTTLAPGNVVPATFNLAVSSNTGDLSSFSFHIVISGSTTP